MTATTFPWPATLPQIPLNDGGDTVVYFIVMEDMRNEGVQVLPVYSPDPTNPNPNVVVRLHSPIETFTIQWQANRHVAPAQVPSPKSLDSNAVFLQGGRSRTTPLKDSSGLNFDYAIAGWYQYARILPVGLDSAWPNSKTFWEASDVSAFIIPASVFRQDLVDYPGRVPPGTASAYVAGS